MTAASDHLAPPATRAAARSPARPADPDPAATPPPIVFVGGTGRSGTHVVARLLGRHSAYADVPIECRFHVNPRGFPDLLAGRVTEREFLRKLRGFWWRRIKAGEPLAALAPWLPLGRELRGLHKIMPRERLDRAVGRFEAADPGDLEAACRTLFLDILWPLAEQAGKPGLVEMSCFTVAQAPTLLRLFPEARIVHTVRDGRDAGVSKAGKRQKHTHPRDAGEGIEWWLGRLAEAEAGLREVPEGRALTIGLDELVAGDRKGAYASLLEFLGIEDEPAMHEFFEREVTAANAHRGRWREGLAPAEQRAVAARYGRALEQAAQSGYRSAPLLRRVFEGEGAL